MLMMCFAVVDEAYEHIKLMRKEETVVTGKPRYDSKSRGIVENANGLVKVC